MNDGTIPHALCIEKNMGTTSSVSERGDMDSENQCGDPEYRITLFEIKSIKTDNIGGYIINKHTTIQPLVILL